jgi:general secretion pathway protein K
MTSVDRKRGIVLVVALWSIVLLSALAMAASTTFRVFGGMVSMSLDRAKAGALLDAGVAAGALVLATLKEQEPLTAREFNVTLATGSVHVSLSDETGRINVNKAPPKVLSTLLQYVGVEDADAIATSSLHGADRIRRSRRLETADLDRLPSNSLGRTSNQTMRRIHRTMRPRSRI